MTQPTTRATLKDYAKRKLGYPVVDLNIDDDQMEDCIDDALEYFQEYHFDGTYPTFVKKQISGSTLKIFLAFIFLMVRIIKFELHLLGGLQKSLLSK